MYLFRVTKKSFLKNFIVIDCVAAKREGHFYGCRFVLRSDTFLLEVFMSSKNLLKLQDEIIDEIIIDKNEKWFKFYLNFPLIFAVISAVACFILGIAAADWWGGVFLLVFWGGGAVYCLLQYAFFKAVFSYFILHIYYLKKISLKDEEKKEIEMEQPDELPEI